MKGAGPLFAMKSAGPGAMAPLAPPKTATDSMDRELKGSSQMLCPMSLTI